jgi:hypothetical protein
MRHALATLFLLSHLLSSCQGPRVTVLVNELKPGMLRGRTVGIGGMVATFAEWPGKRIEPPILPQAETALQRSLKGSRVYVLPADLTTYASAAAPYDGNMSSSAALDATVMRFAKAHADLADYFFMMFLRTDSVSHIKKGGEGTDYMVLGERTRGSLWGSRYAWRGLTEHELKVDYLVYDSRTNRIVWRAKAVFSDEDVSINNSGTPPKRAEWMPATPTERLWVPMNQFTARTLRKSGAASHQGRMIGGWLLN